MSEQQQQQQQHEQQNDTSEVPKVILEATNNDEKSEKEGEDEDDLEEGELKDDDDDDDDDFDDESNLAPGRLLNYNNDANNNDGFQKEPNFSDQRQQTHGSHAQNFHLTQHNNGGQGPPYSFHHQPNRRHHSPNNRQQHHLPEMLGQFAPNQQFVNNINNSNNNNNNHRYPTNHDAGIGTSQPLPPHIGHQMHQMAGPPDAMFNRGGPGGVGPMQKISNVKCRFYSKTNNKCTWGDNCRFEHRDDSPGSEFENRIPGPGMSVPGPNRVPPPMGPMDRPYPLYASRHQPYLPHPPPPHGYSPYESPYGQPHHHSTPPPLPPHHWPQQHTPYLPPSSSGHPPESLSPGHLSAAGNSSAPIMSNSGSRGSSAQPSNSSGNAQPPPPAGTMPPATGGNGGPSSPNYPSQSSVVYERKHRLAYELAPWNDRGYPPPSNRYDHRAFPGGGGPGSGYPPPPTARGVFYRSHYGREPYGREPMPPHLSSSGGAHPYPAGYPPNYPSASRTGPMGPHASHYKYMSSSHRNMPPDVRRSRSNKRGHDEDESSWSDSGSEDSILGQASYSKNKMSKKQHNLQQSATTQEESASTEDPLGQGSGTPPGEALSEDMLNRIEEVEAYLAKEKGEQ